MFRTRPIVTFKAYLELLHLYVKVDLIKLSKSTQAMFGNPAENLAPLNALTPKQLQGDIYDNVEVFMMKHNTMTR